MKKKSPQKKHTHASARENLGDVLSADRDTDVDLNPIPKPYRKKKTTNKLIYITSVSLIIFSAIYAINLWKGPEGNIQQDPPKEIVDNPTGTGDIANATLPNKDETDQEDSDIIGKENTVTPIIQIDAAHLTLEKFLKASNLNERTRHILNSEKLLPKIIEYYKENPITIEEAEIVSNTENTALSSGDSYFRIFQVTTKQQNEPFPVYLENTESGWKVSWSSFIQFNENLLGKFLQNYQVEEMTFYTKL